MKIGRLFIIGLLVVGPASAQQEQRKNFAGCPVVQDTKTVPCWLSEYAGELYYLGIQTDPPYLGHKVLVEGVVSNEPRICGGIVLKPVVVSPLPEFDSLCNTILPAVDKYTVPSASRPPGPVAAPTGPEFPIYYDFDAPIMGRHAGILTQIVEYAEKSQAKRITVTGYRGATLLSDKTVLTEQAGIAKARAEEVADLLKRAGLSKTVIQVTFRDQPEPARGIDDWRSRRTTVRVEP